LFDRFRRRPAQPAPPPPQPTPEPDPAPPALDAEPSPPPAPTTVVGETAPLDTAAIDAPSAHPETPVEEPPAPDRAGVFSRFRKLTESVQRTRDTWFYRLDNILDQRTISEELYEELEEVLIQADVGVETSEKVIERLRARVRTDHIRIGADARQALKEILIEMLPTVPYTVPTERPAVILIVGVNGVGKTTSIAKLAQYLRDHNRRVLLAAGDTFRAAAIDQLKVWGDRVGVDVVAHQPDADPGAVVFDAMQAAQGRNIDALIIDTAGRLHTKFNLMEELRKIKRVLAKNDATAPHQVLLVMDATTGQNGLAQARHFTEAVGVTGIVLAKLDGTAKGGIVFAIADELKIPIQFVGTGEKIPDLAEFDPVQFVDALIGG
jgi:fused signal recognition particle receptor